MKKDILTITSVALTTAALTVLSFWSVPIEAGDEGKAPKVAQPKLVDNGIEMTVVAEDGKSFAAGEAFSFVLKAVNTTDKPAYAVVEAGLNSVSLGDEMRRTPARPAKVWQQQKAIALAPNETITTTLSANTNLTDATSYSLMLAPVDASDRPLESRAAQTPQSSQATTAPMPGAITALAFSTKK